MSEIKRYCFEQVTENDCAMIEDDYGQYVTFDDHESRIKQLEQELAEAKKDQARYQFLRDKLVQAVDAIAAQTGESAESIIEWLTDQGGLTQLMLSHFGGIAAQAQQPETVTVQQAWEWAGGNPEIKATIKDLEEALRLLDEVCEEADKPAQAQQSQWISVEERLPDERVEVAVCGINKWLNRNELFCIGTAKLFCGNWVNVGHIAVTHWLPLPPAPEGDK